MQTESNPSDISHQPLIPNKLIKPSKNNPSSSITHTHHGILPIPSLDPQGKPCGKTHAGEVQRRSDRQRSALPPPGVPLSNRDTVNNNRRSRRPGRRDTTGGGGYGSESDSDSDRKPGRDQDKHDRESIKRGKRPAPPLNHYSETPLPSGCMLDDEEEALKHRLMQKTLKLVTENMANSVTDLEQSKEMARLSMELPSSQGAGAIRSETYDMMIEYMERNKERAMEDSLAAFMRQSDSSSSIEACEENDENLKQRRHDFMRILQSGHINYKFMVINKSPLPNYVTELFGLSRFQGPIVLRVLMKDGTPRYAEVVGFRLLENLEWYYSPKSRSLECYKRGDTKFTGHIIYQVTMTGKVRGVWQVEDADDDQMFLDFQKEKKLAAERRKRRSDMESLSEMGVLRAQFYTRNWL